MVLRRQQAANDRRGFNSHSLTRRVARLTIYTLVPTARLVWSLRVGAARTPRAHLRLCPSTALMVKGRLSASSRMATVPRWFGSICAPSSRVGTSGCITQRCRRRPHGLVYIRRVRHESHGRRHSSHGARRSLRNSSNAHFTTGRALLLDGSITRHYGRR